MKLTFCVPGVAHAWSRTRLAFDGLGRVRPVNTAALRDYEHQVASAAALAAKAQGWRTVPAGVPVVMSIVAYFPVPASATKRQQEWLPGTLHALRPDRDNVAKAIADALGRPDGNLPRAGVVDDDAQFADGPITKRWCRRGEERVEVEITC